MLVEDLGATTKPTGRSASDTVTRAASVLAVLALALRFAWPDVIAFGGEQVESIALAYRSWYVEPAVHGLRVSLGLEMPPFYLWLLSLPVALTQDPVRVTQFVTCVNVLALLVLWRVLARDLSRLEAALAIALLASSPWAHVFARKIWAQDFLLPATVAWLAIMSSHLARPRPYKVWLGALALSAYFQIYPATWFAAVPIAVGLWLAAPVIRVRDALVAVALGVALWVPYLSYQFAVDFDDVRYAAAAMAQPSGDDAVLPRGMGAHFAGALGLSGGTGMDWLLGREGFAAWTSATSARALHAAALAFVPLAACASLWALARFGWALRERAVGRSLPARERTLALLAAMFFGVLLQYVSLDRPAIAHYHVVLWPAVPVFLAAGVASLAPRLPRLATAGSGLLCAFALLHTVEWISFQRFVAVHGGGQGAHAPIYRGARAALDAELSAALDEVREGPARRAREQAELRVRFEASRDVVLALDGRSESTSARCASGCDATPSPRGLEVVNHTPPGFVDLPASTPVAGDVLLRLDVETPIEAVLLVYFTTPAAPRFRRDQVHAVRLARGAQSAFVSLAGAAPGGPIRLSFLCHRLRIERIELRRV